MSPTRAELIRTATGTLAAAGVDEPARDARLLLRWASGLEASALAADLAAIPGSAELDGFRMAVDRRAAREPLSHITGRRSFWGRDFFVTSDVLDPRPESETLIAEALHRGPYERILDLGTGSGCLLVTLLAEWPEAHGTGTDISQAALAVAGQNAAAHGVAGRAEFRHGDWLEGIDGTFDLVVANPPYIAEAEMADLAPEVRDYEPHRALTPGGDGLDAYRAIARGIRAVLRPRGRLMLEIGPTQSQSVAVILAAEGLNVIGLIPDLDQRPRVVTAQV